jgi:hypothetical protein
MRAICFSAHNSDMARLFFGQPAKNAVYLLRASWVVGEVGALLRSGTVPGVVAGGLAAAFAQGESMAGMRRVVVQAYIALPWPVDFLNEPCWSAAEEAPVFLDCLQEGYK